MVSLIKNQILKHLSRYTKNLSLDKINVSTFKGEGELTSLQLDEIVLTDLLELPLWLRLTSAWCNKVAFRVQWTKLKTVPIFISLDEVTVEIETCEELRSMSASQGLSTYGTATKYNFINKVIDGMTIAVNIVTISFKSPAFESTVEIMRILVESKSPEWERTDLTHTRLKDSIKGQTLIFKELEWQTLRIQASSTKDPDLPPLRLLTHNKARCRLTIKKRISDCFVMGCKLLLIFEDLLWVLTDSQLKAALHFTESLSGLVQKATEVTRIKKAARKLEVLPEYQAQLAQEARAADLSSKAFEHYDVIETSYHFWAHKIDLHLTDDPGDGRSCHPLLREGSALRLLVHSLQIDCYPYHLAAGDRSHWARYNDASSPHVLWLDAAHAIFKSSLLQLFETDRLSSSYVHSNGELGESGLRGKTHGPSSPTSNPIKEDVLSQLAKVMTSCIILRVTDFVIYEITTNNKQSPREFMKGDKEKLTVPSDVTIHAEFTYFYYPGDIPFPLPPPKFYVQVNPVQVYFNVLTIIWLNSFALNLYQSILNSRKETNHVNYVDIKIEAIMPRLIFESSCDTQYGQRDRPKALHVHVSRVLMSNVRSPDTCSRADLAKCINASQLGSLFYNSEFPAKPDDLHLITDKFVKHVQGEDCIPTPGLKLPIESIEELRNVLRKDMLWVDARDVWCVKLEPVWGDFYGARGVAHNRPVPFLDNFPLDIWLHIDEELHSTDISAKHNIHAIAYISNLVSLQINHYQLLFLLRLADEFTEVVTMVGIDSDRIRNENNGSFVLGAVIPQLEITLVMSSQIHGKESSGADIESVLPDTSSLADDIITTPSIQWSNVLSSNIQDNFQKRGNIHSTTSPPSEQISTDISAHSKLDLKCSSNNILGLSSVKKGLANITVFLDTALKPDDIDTLAIKSDGSSDSDNYFAKLAAQVTDPMFRIEGHEPNSGVEFASEVVEDEDNHSGATLSMTTLSENHSTASFYHRKDMIATVTFKLGQVEFMEQSVGFQSVMKIHISNVAIEECSAIPWDEFQNKFTTRSRGWNEVCEEAAERPRIRLRMEHSVEVDDPKTWTGPNNCSWFTDLLTISLANITVKINSSMLTAIADFFTDDIASQPLPMEISLDNIELDLAEDRLNTLPNGGTPLNLNVSHLRIRKTKEGVFLIEPLLSANTDIISNELTELRAENDQLRRRLAAMERLNEENHYLRKCEEETHVLRSCLNEAHDSVNTLLEEKKGLLEFIKSIQVAKGEGKQQSSGKR